jgi:VIT1/CCC1 family predicted Fe2+/Mn2+ transporter
MSINSAPPDPTRVQIGSQEIDVAWLKAHMERERRRSDLLGEIREAVFGAQDGLISTLAVVSTVGGATGNPFAVLIAGVASALAGVFSMSAGEYMSSKSQREIFDAQIADEVEEVKQRPAEAQAEVAYLLRREGLMRDSALRVANELASNQRVLLRTMVEKELGIVPDEGSPFRGAIIMGGSFGLAALVPILPYLLLRADLALYVSVGLTGLALFVMGVLKSQWTRRPWWRSGLEVLGIGAFAGIVGHLFGTALPALLGVAGVTQ